LDFAREEFKRNRGVKDLVRPCLVLIMDGGIGAK
jgi:hypothetical protein